MSNKLIWETGDVQMRIAKSIGQGSTYRSAEVFAHVHHDDTIERDADQGVKNHEPTAAYCGWIQITVTYSK